MPTPGEPPLLERAARAQKWRKMAAAAAAVPQCFWFPDGRLWFARAKPDGGRAWMEVDTASGACRPAFDAAKVAAQLRLAGVAADPRKLDLPLLKTDDGTPRFQAGGKAFAFKEGLPAVLPPEPGAAAKGKPARHPEPPVLRDL